MIIYLLSGLLIVHGIVCLLGAFFPFYPPIYFFYVFFPGHFAIRLIIVLIIGAAQLAYGVHLVLGKRWKIRWYWPAIATVVITGLLLIYPAVQSPGLFGVSAGKEENRQPIPVKDLLPVHGEEAPDDIVPAPGMGPAYRANIRQQGVENPWPPIDTTKVTITSSFEADTVYVRYRDYIETEAGESRNNVVFISMGNRAVRNLNLYTVNLPAGIEVTEGMRWHGPGPVSAVLVIEISPDVQPGQHDFDICIEIDGKDYGVIPCTIKVIDSTTPGKTHTLIPLRETPGSSVDPEAPDALAPVPTMAPTYRANVHQTGVENPWPPIEISEAYLDSGTDEAHIYYRSHIETAAGETRNNIIRATLSENDIRSMSLYANDVPAGIKLTIGSEWSGPLSTSRALLLVIEISPNIAIGRYPLEIGLEINDKDYGTIPCTIKVTSETTPTSAPQPIPQQPAELPLRIVSVTSPINPGLYATLVIETLPGAECSAIVDYGSSGNSVLHSKIADGSGRVSWTWTVGGFSGTWQIVVKATYGGKTASQITPFTVR